MLIFERQSVFRAEIRILSRLPCLTDHVPSPSSLSRQPPDTPVSTSQPDAVLELYSGGQQ